MKRQFVLVELKSDLTVKKRTAFDKYSDLKKEIESKEIVTYKIDTIFLKGVDSEDREV